MTEYVWENLVRVVLTSTLAESATSMTIDEPVGAFNLPPNPSGNVGVLVLADSMDAPTAIEIVSYTGRADNENGTWTITGLTRGLHGTSDAEWPAGTTVYQDMVAQLIGTAATRNTGTSADEVVLRGTSGTIPAAAGIYVGGSASANLLGAVDMLSAWTPVFSFDGNTTGFAYNAQYGRVTKIGRIVFAFWQINFSAKGTAAGTLRLQNLPYTIYNSTWGYNPHMTIHHADGFTGLKGTFSGNIAVNNTYVTLVHKNSGENFAGISTGALPASGTLSGIVCYESAT